MPRYKFSLTLDVDNIPNHLAAERIAEAIERDFRNTFSYIVYPVSEERLSLHNITNVESHLPSIIANHDKD